MCVKCLMLTLQEKTLIGRPDGSHEQDIQLLGLGIMPEHCVIVVDGSDVVLIPLDGARCAAKFIILQLSSNLAAYIWQTMLYEYVRRCCLTSGR